MLILRLIGALVLITFGASLVLYLFTRNRRYLRFAWRVVQFGLAFAIAFLVLYLMERLLLVI